MLILYMVLKILLVVAGLALLLFGFVQSIKHSFAAGVCFFVIIIICRFFPYIFSPYIRSYIDSLNKTGKVPLGMTVGEFVAWYSLVPQVVEVVAFGFLVVGLYRMWKLRAIKQ